MTSNTNTSGLEVVAWRMVLPDGSLSAIQSKPFHAGFEKMMATDLGCVVEPLVTAASAQARIDAVQARVAELEAAAAIERLSAENEALIDKVLNAAAAYLIDTYGPSYGLDNEIDRARIKATLKGADQ